MSCVLDPVAASYEITLGIVVQRNRAGVVEPGLRRAYNAIENYYRLVTGETMPDALPTLPPALGALLARASVPPRLLHDPAPGQADAQRPLSTVGLAEATAAGQWLREHGLLPGRVLCSPAVRASQTLAALGALGCDDVREEPSIYEADPGTLAALADAHRDAERLMIVGHNPGLEQLAALLHSGQTGDYRGMPPSGVAVLEFPADAAVEPGAARLSQFWWP